MRCDNPLFYSLLGLIIGLLALNTGFRPPMWLCVGVVIGSMIWAAIESDLTRPRR